MAIKKNLLLYLAIAIPVAIIFAYLSTQPCDLDVFMDGAAKFQAGTNPYGRPFPHGLQYYYSPFFAMILSFFLKVPVSVLKFIWMTGMLLALWRTTSLFKTFFPAHVSDKRTEYWIWIVVILSAYFLWLNITATQMTVFILWAAFEAVTMASKKKALTTGLIVGLFINIKLLMLPILAYLVYRGYFKASLYSVITFFFLLLVPMLYVGWENNLELHSLWWNSVNPQNPEHIAEQGTGWYSLSAMIPKYFSAENSPTVLLGARLFFVALTLYFLNTKPFAASPNQLHQFRELSYLCMVIILIFPHQRFYSYFFLFPAITYNVYIFLFHSGLFSRPAYQFSIILFIISTLILFLGKDVVGQDFFSWLYRYAAHTWSVIGLIIVLGILKPKKALQSSFSP